MRKWPRQRRGHQGRGGKRRWSSEQWREEGHNMATPGRAPPGGWAWVGGARTALQCDNSAIPAAMMCVGKPRRRDWGEEAGRWMRLCTVSTSPRPDQQPFAPAIETNDGHGRGHAASTPFTAPHPVTQRHSTLATARPVPCALRTWRARGRTRVGRTSASATAPGTLTGALCSAVRSPAPLTNQPGKTAAAACVECPHST